MTGWIHPRTRPSLVLRQLRVIISIYLFISFFASFRLQFAAPTLRRRVVKLYPCIRPRLRTQDLNSVRSQKKTLGPCQERRERGEVARTVYSREWSSGDKKKQQHSGRATTTCRGKSPSATSRRRNSSKSSGREREVKRRRRANGSSLLANGVFVCASVSVTVRYRSRAMPRAFSLGAFTGSRRAWRNDRTLTCACV